MNTPVEFLIPDDNAELAPSLKALLEYIDGIEKEDPSELSKKLDLGMLLARIESVQMRAPEQVSQILRKIDRFIEPLAKKDLLLAAKGDGEESNEAKEARIIEVINEMTAACPNKQVDGWDKIGTLLSEKKGDCIARSSLMCVALRRLYPELILYLDFPWRSNDGVGHQQVIFAFPWAPERYYLVNPPLPVRPAPRPPYVLESPERLLMGIEAHKLEKNKSFPFDVRLAAEQREKPSKTAAVGERGLPNFLSYVVPTEGAPYQGHPPSRLDHLRSMTRRWLLPALAALSILDLASSVALERTIIDETVNATKDTEKTPPKPSTAVDFKDLPKPTQALLLSSTFSTSSEALELEEAYIDEMHKKLEQTLGVAKRRNYMNYDIMNEYDDASPLALEDRRVAKDCYDYLTKLFFRRLGNQKQVGDLFRRRIHFKDGTYIWGEPDTDGIPSFHYYAERKIINGRTYNDVPIFYLSQYGLGSYL